MGGKTGRALAPIVLAVSATMIMAAVVVQPTFTCLIAMVGRSLASNSQGLVSFGSPRTLAQLAMKCAVVAFISMNGFYPRREVGDIGHILQAMSLVGVRLPERCLPVARLDTSLDSSGLLVACTTVIRPPVPAASDRDDLSGLRFSGRV